MGQDSANHIGRIEESSFSYVILLPEGHFNFQVKPQEITNIFGNFGPGQFGQIPNGFVVQNGVANRLIVQGPRVELKAANQDLLLTMLAGCRTHLGNVLMSRNARAFGINNEYFLYFDRNDITREVFLQRLGSDKFEGKTVTQITILQNRPVEPNVKDKTIITLDEDTPDRLVCNNNVHIPNPPNPMLNETALRMELDKAQKSRTAFLTELTTCVTLQN